ncbi:hypothetical protein ID875_21550 [Streptomyces globisporus]|uniref:Uncharacterized protein n=1 Tax=Streptomyces globisporus TaxID=1908 RepID=A0A927BLK1_STRGL|nr:hypothetical protein [Streptomyces globisporus]
MSQTAKKLLAQAADDYRKHNSPKTAAAYRIGRGQAQTSGNAAAGAPRGGSRS